MSHSFTQNILHIVFSTKERRKMIAPDFQRDLWDFCGAICRNEGIWVNAIGGIEDHVHFLLYLPATQNVSKTVGTIKANSARFANRKKRPLEWQQGFAALSVSASLVSTVTRYIHSQAAHHRKVSFEEEFVALLSEHNIPFDSKYMLG